MYVGLALHFCVSNASKRSSIHWKNYLQFFYLVQIQSDKNRSSILLSRFHHLEQYFKGMYSKIGSLQPNYGNDVYISALFVRYKFIEIQSNLYLFLLCRLGEVCSHVGALLFKIEMGVKMGLTLSSSTSKACQWNSTFRKEVI